MNKLILAGVALILTGCASTSTGVVPEGPDTFMVSRQCGYGQMDVGERKVESIHEGTEYCAKGGKQFLMTGSTDSPTWPTHYCTVEIHFKCVDSRQPASAQK